MNYKTLLPIFFLAAAIARASTEPSANSESASSSKQAAAEKWCSLFDEKLSAWELWMGVPHQSVTNLPAGTPTSLSCHSGPAMGLGNDPKHVFNVRKEGGEPIIYVTGEIYGALTTKESFTNYHFRIDVKWGEKKWEPRLNLVRNTGLLYHCTGPHGAFWSAWKRCLEFEIQEKDFGDLYLLAGTRAEVVVKKVGKLFVYDPAGERVTFGAGIKEPGHGRAAHLPGDFEKPSGEWNTLDLYTIGRTAVHVVNGQVANVIRNTSNLEGQTEVPLEGGQLQLQSEAAEVYFRRAQICPLSDFPAEIKQAAGL